jgi:intein/homing endonuclease
MDTANFENDEAVIISEREDELYEVELEDGRTVTLNANHPFIVEQDGSFVQKSINDGLKIGDTVVIA